MIKTLESMIIFSNDSHFNSNYVVSHKPLDFNLVFPKDFVWLVNNNHNVIKNLGLKYSSEWYFSNGVIKREEFSSKTFKLKFAEYRWFNSSFITPSLLNPTFTFSQGLFPYYERMDLLQPESESTYDDLENTLENKNVNYYYFDNSVPSKETILQSRVISWGMNDLIVQSSFRLPSYSLDFEYKTEYFNKKYELNNEFNFIPKQPTDESLNFAYNAVFADDILNWEWSPGHALTVAGNFEYGKVPGQVYPLNYESYIGYPMTLVNNFEFKNVYITNEHLNYEMQMDEISRYGKLNYEFLSGQLGLEGLNFETVSEYGGNVNWETLTFAPYERDINFEFVKVQPDDIVLNYEFKNIYIDDYNINFESYIEIVKDYNLNTEFFIDRVQRKIDFEYAHIYYENYNLNFETSIPELWKDYNLNFETSIPELWKDYNLNFEFKNIVIDTDSINTEINIPEIYKDYNLPFETLVFASTDDNLNFEAMRYEEKTVTVQSYIVPISYLDTIIQINVNAFINGDLPFEINVTELPGTTSIDFESYIEIDMTTNLDFETSIPELWKDYNAQIEVNVNEIWTDSNINYEFKNIYEDGDHINFESKTVIESDYDLPFESYTEIDMNYNIDLEYLATLPFDIPINFESQTVIWKDYDINFEYEIEKLWKDYNINLETYIEIDKNYWFNFEAFVDEVSKHLHFEFDILDLVYYVVSKGYNIVPFSYSQGEGFWDTNSNKNWNKEEIKTTMESGFLNQLQEQGYTIPDILQYSDKNLDAFGCFIPGKSKDMNIQDSLLYFEAKEDYTLVLGKRKREPLEIVHLKKGNNLIAYDGAFKIDNMPTFSIIKEQIKNEFNYCSVWDQLNGKWRTIIDEDHDLYFIQNIDDQDQPVPYLLMINVSNDCSFEVKR